MEQPEDITQDRFECKANSALYVVCTPHTLPEAEKRYPMVNQQRLQEHLVRLSQIGRLESGGIHRSSLSPEDSQARALVGSWLESAGFTLREDGARNLVASLPGTLENAEVLMLGSHIDTVPNGGAFDGALGVLGGLEAVQGALEDGYVFRHPVELVIFCDEEGAERLGCLGSTLMFEDLAPEVLAGKAPGREQTVSERLGSMGLDIKRASREKRNPHDILAYLELHIEQGGVLESEELEIGVVQGIVGIRRYEWQISGKANHAGTTPMHLRDDALVKAARLIGELNTLASRKEHLVATVGHLTLEPNAVNVVPGLVKFSEEVRSMYPKLIDELHASFVDTASSIPGASMRGTSASPPIWLSELVRNVIADNAANANMKFKHMVSGAGHDAAAFAVAGVPTGMIFVPSIGGVSHAPHEFTPYELCAKGSDLLRRTLLTLDQLDSLHVKCTP